MRTEFIIQKRLSQLQEYRLECFKCLDLEKNQQQCDYYVSEINTLNEKIEELKWILELQNSGF